MSVKKFIIIKGEAMNAKYVIEKLSNGWVLYFDGDGLFYETLESLFDAIRTQEKEEA